MTPIDTAELERLAASITPGEWYAHETHPQNACAYVSARREFMDQEIATLYQGESDDAGQDRAGIWGDHPERRANASAIALLPALICEVLAHRKAEAGMRALLRAGCDLLAIESEALRNSIRIVGDPDRLSDAPEDAHAVEAIREIEDWIASVKATLYPTTPEAEGGCDAE